MFAQHHFTTRQTPGSIEKRLRLGVIFIGRTAAPEKPK
jgi:hypothetical protein